MIFEDKYPEEYYKTLNYSDYLEREPRYIKTAQEIIDILKRLSLIHNNSHILDYGCALGFLMKGFKEQGYSEIMGFEISEWARDYAHKNGHRVFSNLDHIGEYLFDLIIALDVFEHLSDEELIVVLSVISAKVMIVRIPVAEPPEKDFYLSVTKKDPTHINPKSKEEWINFFRGFGFNTFLKLNLFSLYDSKGVLCLLILK